VIAMRQYGDTATANNREPDVLRGTASIAAGSLSPAALGVFDGVPDGHIGGERVADTISSPSKAVR
jgi:hypothetical protein